MRIGIVASDYHWDEIVGRMVDLAMEEARVAGADVELIRVPGCYELPYGAQQLLARGVDGVVAYGALLKGETLHDEIIGHAVAKALLDLSLTHKKPVVLGVQGPKMTKEQAIARIPRAAEVMHACLRLVKQH